MRIHYMQEAVALARNLNFTKTSHELFISQSTLSKHLSLIEKSLNVQLFVRNKHTVSLTTEGKLIIEDFKRILNEYDAMMNRISLTSQGARGHLCVGVLGYAVDEYIAPIVSSFREHYPNVKLLFVSDQPHMLMPKLLTHEIDIIQFIHYRQPHMNNARYTDIGIEPLMVLATKDHALAQKNFVTLDDLRNAHYVFIYNDPLSDYVKSLLTKHGITNPSYTYTESIDTVPFSLMEVQGIHIVPNHIRKMPWSNMRLIGIDCQDFTVLMSLVHHANNNTPAIPYFLAEAKKVHPQLSMK